MEWAPHQLTLHQSAQKIAGTPHVKSSTFEKLFNDGAGFWNRNFQNRKNRGPHLLDSLCRMEIHRDGLFENVESDMERAVAIKKLGKLLGKKLGYRVNDKAPTQDERDAARAELTTAIEERNKLKEKRDERYKAILAADAEYQSLHAAHRAAHDRVDRLFSVTRHYKFTVGTSEGMFFLVKAEGDSWEQIIDKLTVKQAA